MYINLIIYFSPPQKQPRRHPNQKSSSFGTEEQRRIRNYIDAFDDFAAVLLNNEHRWDSAHAFQLGCGLVRYAPEWYW